MPKEERKVLLAYSLIKTSNLINLNLFTYYLYLFIYFMFGFKACHSEIAGKTPIAITSSRNAQRCS